MSFNVANSSFIFERRRRSIRLWAVLRAIFRPATLVELGCFRFELEFEGEVAGSAFGVGLFVGGVFGWSFVDLGFMWIILRGRAGGGGSVKSSLGFLLLPEEVRFRRGLVFRALCVGDVGVAGL